MITVTVKAVEVSVVYDRTSKHGEVFSRDHDASRSVAEVDDTARDRNTTSEGQQVLTQKSEKSSSPEPNKSREAASSPNPTQMDEEDEVSKILYKHWLASGS